MKTKIRELFNRVITLLLVAIIFGGVPLTVFAESNSLDSVSHAEDTVAEIENVVSSGEGGYSYTPPDEGNFLIESVTGSVSILNNVPVIQFKNFSVSSPTFDYYKIVDLNGNVRFYQADVLKNPDQTNNFVYIGIYVNDGPTYSIHVQYAVNDEDKLYNILAPLTEEEFSFFTENSTEISLGTDAVSQRLKSSGRVYAQGTFENYDYSGTNNEENVNYNDSVSSYALNEVAINSYDS